MSKRRSLELRVSVDVGYRHHSVAIGLPDGQVLEEFEITHRPEIQQSRELLFDPGEVGKPRGIILPVRVDCSKDQSVAQDHIEVDLIDRDGFDGAAPGQ